MNRIQELFQRKKSDILNVYYTAGFPQLNDTLKVMKALQDNGTDIIELGMPYSDPLADGPMIQSSNTQALQNGMTIELLFEQLRGFRNGSASADRGIYIPVLLMGYMNPVLQFGFERFCQQAADIPVDGLILPDLPEYEFENEYGPVIRRYGLDFVFLVTPETSEERIRKLDSLSTGFLYAVSSSSTTGNEKDFNAVENYLERLRQMHLKNPIIVGFGIKDKQSFKAACRHANGAVIGSAFIRALQRADDIEQTTRQFLSSILR